MNFKTKRALWYFGATVSAAAIYIFLNAALHVAWLSAFTHAEAAKLRIHFIAYCALLIVAAVGLVFCVKRGNASKENN